MAKKKKLDWWKRVIAKNIDDHDEPVSERYYVTASMEHTAASAPSNYAESSTGDVFNANNINGGIVGGRNNTNNYTVHVTPPTQAELQVPEALKQAIAPSAFHNSRARGDPPRCHPNTRVAVQEEILNWSHGLDPNSAVMWLHGRAGSGKTAIAQTVADRLFQQKMLLASFFFGRLDSSRNSSRSLVATIAYQTALRLPDEVAHRIFSVINRNPTVFHLTLELQISLLLFEPLIESGYFANNKGPQVVVIDGLDECVNRKEQGDILRSLSAVLQKHQLPIRFLIASRPEPEIKDAFTSDVLKGISTRLNLENVYQTYSDIRCFLTAEFKNIKQTHILANLFPAEWPSQEIISELVRKSSGQFIYASTVVKFVKEKRGRPDQRLDIILGISPPGSKDLQPFADLDALYRHLFSAVEDWEKTSLILAFYTLHPNSSAFPIAVIEVLLGLQPGDCRLLLYDLASIIDVEGNYLTFCHASVQDFLLDQTRSKEFYIDPPTWHAKLARVLLHFFRDSSPLQWRAHGMKVDLTILSPHIELANGSLNLEAEILSFDVLRFFDPEFPPRVAYSIPDYLSIINNSVCA